MPRTIITPTRFSIFNPLAGPSPPPNDPFVNPSTNVRSILFDGRFGYYSVAASADTVVNHAAIAADPGLSFNNLVSVPGIGGLMTVFNVNTYLARTITSYVLITHALGVIPHYKVYDELGALLSPARPIQQVTSGGFTGYRTVRIRATTSQIILDEIAMPGKNGIAAISKTYHVRCFQPLGPVSGVPGFLGRPSRAQMAHGQADSAEEFMRVALSGEAHSIKPFGRASDLNNGQIRFITADGTTYDTNTVIGSSNSPYGGSFTGPNLVNTIV